MKIGECLWGIPAEAAIPAMRLLLAAAGVVVLLGVTYAIFDYMADLLTPGVAPGWAIFSVSVGAAAVAKIFHAYRQLRAS